MIGLVIGEPGTTVALTLQRPEVDEPLRVEARRIVVRAPSVRGVRRDAAGRSGFLLDAERGIGYVRISRLAEDTVAAFEAALDELATAGARGLVLDLRGSSGGMAKAAVAVADLLLDRGRILTSETREGLEHDDATPGGHTVMPVVALIDGGTASSSEFLAAALQDNGRAVMVGSRTFGKARLQRMIPLGEGRGGVVLSTGRFVRPSGAAVDRHDAPDAAGVAPDPGMEVALAPAEQEAWQDEAAARDSFVEFHAAAGSLPDPVLERGLSVLESLLANRPGAAAP